MTRRSTTLIHSVFPSLQSATTQLDPPPSQLHNVASPTVITRSRKRSPVKAFSAATETERWSQAWNLFQARFSLSEPIAPFTSLGSLLSPHQDPQLHNALQIVMNPVSSNVVSVDPLVWFVERTRLHYSRYIGPSIINIFSEDRSSSDASLGKRIDAMLAILEVFYEYHVQWHDLLVSATVRKDHRVEKKHQSYVRELKLICSSLLDSQAVHRPMKQFLHGCICSILLVKPSLSPIELGPSLEERLSSEASKRDLLRIVRQLDKVGCTGDRFQSLCAKILDGIMDIYISTYYSKQWQWADHATASPNTMRIGSLCIRCIGQWVETYFASLALSIFDTIGVSYNRTLELITWKEIAIDRLASLRIHELYDIVLRWPQSMGGLDDLRASITTPKRRLELTDTFSSAIQRRLLHADSSTLHILKVYIQIIRAFHTLDPSKVFLDRVVNSLQLYLFQRDDAVAIVVAGLLANPDEGASSATTEGKLVELAILLNDQQTQPRSKTLPKIKDQPVENEPGDENDPDWNDMEWVPLPADAVSTSQRRPKSEDIIGTLISALGSQELFIKQFQTLVATRLLTDKEGDFVQEVKLLRLLKKKFGDSALQSCDVMLKDILDSRKLDPAICRVLPAPSTSGLPEYHATILSRLYWPYSSPEHMIIPERVEEMQQRYAQAFSRFKSNRKLEWLNQLGTATLRLDLEDRTVEVVCKTYEAVVLHGFEDGQAYSADDLYLSVQLDPDMIQESLDFWVEQKVLYETEEGVYAVLERLSVLEELSRKEKERRQQQLSMEDEEDGTSDVEVTEAPAANTSNKNEKDQEAQQIYWQFIVGMLTNSASSMPVAQINMMLQALITGYSWDMVELGSFLEEKVHEGVLEYTGGKYRLKK